MSTAHLGHAALLCAFVVAAYVVVMAVWGGRSRRPELLESARNALFGLAALVTLASGLLLYALFTHDLSIKYVAETSSADAPLGVVLTGFWGGQAGSLLLWTWGLSLLGTAAVAYEFRRYRGLMPGMIGALGTVALFFLGVGSFVANPFETVPVPQPGKGLNPLLWDVGMRIHPPLLLNGYMSFTIPFAVAIGALVSGRLGREWLVPVRRWMLVAWAIQGAGLLAGAWWAYHVLGWGGYWGWDPVENVALLPWLTATAFLHSIMVQERRGMLKVWNVGLVIASFSLAIFGTFVVRSGVISSVHSFAQSTIGPYFMGFFALSLLAALTLLYFRLPMLQNEGVYESVVSREAGFLLNNLLLVAMAAATFWGTIFPLVAELVNGNKVSVGAPFFEQVNGPLMVALMALMGLGPLLAWRYTSAPSLWRTLRWPVAVALAVTALLAVAGMHRGLALLAMAVTLFTLAAIVGEFWKGASVRRGSTGEPLGLALLVVIRKAHRRYGGYIVHLAVVLIAFGVVATQFYQEETTTTLAPGGAMQIGRYTLTYQGLYERDTPGVQGIFARLDVAGSGWLASSGTLEPSRRLYRNWNDQPVSGVAYQTYGPWFDDVYVLLTDWTDSGSATFHVFINPLVSLIWLGGAVFLFGTLIAAWPGAVQFAPPTSQRKEVPLSGTAPAVNGDAVNGTAVNGAPALALATTSSAITVAAPIVPEVASPPVATAPRRGRLVARGNNGQSAPPEHQPNGVLHPDQPAEEATHVF